MALAAAVEPDKPERADDFDALVEQHQRMVYRIAYGVLRNHHDAEDATQEAFLKAWRAAGKLPEVADRKAWMARIAWNAACDRVRQKPGRTDVSLDNLAGSIVERDRAGATAEQIAAGAEMQRLLEALIATLPPKLRDVIVLSTVEELEHEEIGRVLSLNAAAVRMRLFQARQILREKLGRLLGPEARP